MSDPHDREPAGQSTIDCWRVNYGLDKRTPADAAAWWGVQNNGMAPAGCVAALGIALDDLEWQRQQIERLAEELRVACELKRGYQDQLASTAERLTAERDALRAALKPFADADLLNPVVKSTFGFDVLRARAALAARSKT